jgi:uncharacterized membrane protein YagU involved in acid resistance
MLTLLRGAVSGAVATGTMSLVMAAGKRLGLLEVAPPKEITARAAQAADLRPHTMPRPAFDAGWIASHFGFGAAAGALYALLRKFLPLPPAGAGLLYGLAVWVVSYIGLLPSLDLYPPPEHDSPSREGVMIAAHAVYGVTLGEVNERL